ncbi:MAG: hypothetical protein H6961_03175 [Chromatiaceae bacterium]|jgi:hypothetical protein|nr:hypothetical protein [Chromatiaceae bacterium]
MLAIVGADRELEKRKPAQAWARFLPNWAEGLSALPITRSAILWLN